ncbi:hypothetical protein HM003_08335 [Candidatus Bathyarchaeota archaeon A05DMB-5]|nr:hypothetical protein [Candidatus Bathyarchaeota archaeon A05DMB-5]
MLHSNSPPLYAIKFELEEFGQNVSHLTRKTYYTHNFFTDRQVYAALTHRFAFLGTDQYEFEKVPCTFAIPLDVKKHKTFFSINNADLQKEQITAVLRYITEGRQELITPGSEFVTFSFVEPKYDKLFIGKKSALANIVKKEKVFFEEKKDEWTTEDMIYLQEYNSEKNKEIFGVRLADASTRFLVGRFKVSNLLEVRFEDRIYRFYSLWKRRNEFQSNLK